MDLSFVIRDWAALGPGLHTKQEWQAWARSPGPLRGEVPTPDLIEVPAMLRRRISPLGRLAFQAAYWCHASEPGMPVVWASRFGEVSRCLELLGDLNHDQAVSPTSFGLSVHNAVSAQYSIARSDRGNHTALAAGQAGVPDAVIEAIGLLQEGEHPEVLVVHYDAPLPGAYADFNAEPPTPAHAWALRLALPEAGESCIDLRAEGNPGDLTTPAWPSSLDWLRFVIDPDAPANATLTQHTEGQCWTWRRHVAPA